MKRGRSRELIIWFSICSFGPNISDTVINFLNGTKDYVNQMAFYSNSSSNAPSKTFPRMNKCRKKILNEKLILWTTLS